MTLDKRKCRKYADPGFKFDKNSGLLRVAGIKYIVRTAIKNIAGQRMLLLYVCPCENIIGGDFRPRWILFQSRTDYITFAVREDGTTAWQTSIFRNLKREWDFERQCAFYSFLDEQRITRFCGHDPLTGFSALNSLQWRQKEQKELLKRHMKQRKIIVRMEGLPLLPRDLKGWIHREVLPQYIFYDYHRSKAPIKGHCTACGHEVEITGARHNQSGICPRCKRDIVYKARGRLGVISDRDTVSVLQKLSSDELVIRILKVYCIRRPKENITEFDVYENMRIFMRQDNQGNCATEPYHHSFGRGDLTPWKPGYCPVSYTYQPNFNAEICGHLYHRNLDGILEGTPWRYSRLKQFYLRDREPLDAVTYLKALLERPQLGMLFKMGFYKLTCNLIYWDTSFTLINCGQKKTHEILKIWPEDVDDLRDRDGGTADLRAYQKYRDKGLSSSIRREIFGWMERYSLEGDHDILALLPHMTLHKLLRYAEGQFSLLHTRRTDSGDLRYESMDRILGEYQDYLRMCSEQGYDMKNSFVLYPRDLQQAHDRLTARIKAKLDAKRQRDFRDAYRCIVSQMDFELDGMTVVYPQKPEEIEAEGNALHHCVGGYVPRIAEKECMILFLRHISKPQKSFYTIEVREQKVVQVRGMQNRAPTPEVERFMTVWEQKVLRRAKLPAAA